MPESENTAFVPEYIPDPNQTLLVSRPSLDHETAPYFTDGTRENLKCVLMNMKPVPQYRSPYDTPLVNPNMYSVIIMRLRLYLQVC